MLNTVFPFSAIVGQDEMKQALLLTAIDASIGGVLVLGDRGTGKSTAVRALAGLLPRVEVVDGCAYRCSPGEEAGLCAACEPGSRRRKPKTALARVAVVDLPLGATEDRVVGALDIERALTQGVKSFEPGLLARAHRGFLYIDEVNLLDDHLVDVLLDAAASGRNVIERDGLSLAHPARFVLVGSGNPEEGELRPQLLDRFGLSVEIRTPTDLEQRIEVMRRRDAFERDPDAFVDAWDPQERALQARIVSARDRLPGLALDDAFLRATARLCIALGSDGLRGELTLGRAARALAAFDGHPKVDVDHLRRVALPALRHRLRRSPLDEASADQRVGRAIADVLDV
ncbi:MAG: magnesium chelatase ATPase subunit I [Lautropia sp.]